MMFRVGEQVICIQQPNPAAVAKYPGSNYPCLDGIYTIRAINDWPYDDTLLRFEELDNRHFEGVLSKIEPGFPAKYFRSLPSKHGADA
jgi:hypothetical protein